MPCGGCGKNRQSQQKYKVVRSGDVSKQTAKPKPISDAARTIKVERKKGIAVQTKTRERCPTCDGFLKRVSRLGKGDMLQCTNPHCGYLRKLRR